MPTKFTCYIIGEGSLTIKCSEVLLDRGHEIYGMISSNPTIKKWATDNNIKALELNSHLADHLNSKSYDYLFSIINLSILSNDVIQSPRKGAINFHDGPLPQYAGVNAPSWAIMNQEKTYGITWHKIATEIDKGDILKQAIFEISKNETALSLNARCFEKGLSSFGDLVDELGNGANKPIKQNLNDRTYFGKNKRLSQAIIDWNNSAEEISALARALDFGRYPNPLGLPKVKVADEYFIIREVTHTSILSTESPGVITAMNEEYIRVATRTSDIEFRMGLSIDGIPLSIPELIERYSLRKGFTFSRLDDESAGDIAKIDSLIAKREGYWVDLLSTLEFPEIHCARKKVSSEGLSNFRIERVDLPEEVLNFLRNPDSTPQINLASAFAIFIGRLCGKKDFNIGYSDRALLEKIKGHGNLFSECVPLRVTFDPGKGFREVLIGLADVFKKNAENETYARDLWGRYPELDHYIKRGGQRVSPIHIVFSPNLEEYKAQSGGLITFVVPGNPASSSFVFDSFAITKEEIDVLKAQFTGFLKEASGNRDGVVGKIGILSSDEKYKLLKEWNDTKVGVPTDKCIHQLFEEQAARTPESVAIVFKGKNLTYRELNDRSNQLAHRLKELGVGTETLVGVCLHRSPGMAVAVIGILKSGGAYVPLDPQFPKDRISYMIEDSGCPVIITEARLRDGLGMVNAHVITMDTEWEEISKNESGNLKSGVQPQNLSYVIYTSGSTGKPKGVMIEHRNVVNFFTGMDAVIGCDSIGTWLAVTSLSFDISVLEIFWTLVRGFRVVVYPGEESHSKEDEDGLYSIPKLIKHHKVTHFQCTPSMAGMLSLDPEMKDAFGYLKKLLIGGEAFPASLAGELRKVFTGDIINMYGPTETTVWSTAYKLNNDKEKIPIGRPIANTTLYILDDNLQPVPIGALGELVIGGAGLARGYLKRPELTAERFIGDSFSDDPESRLYHTGDLARYLPDGKIEFIGRMDQQIKIRGYRIELGEIEAVLNDCSGVHEAVVVAREEVPGQKKLAAYVVPHEGARVRPDEIRDYAKEKLPGYMVPAYVVLLKAFPKTPNKKIDRKALPPPDKDRLELRTGLEPPQTEIEEALAEIWAEALSLSQVGRNENFFDLGGDSLSACMVILNIQQTCDTDLPLLIMFHAPTIAALAKKLEEAFQKQAVQKAVRSDIPAKEFPEEASSGLEVLFEPPRTPTEKALAALWSKTLRINQVSRNDHFFRLGGKSIDAVRLFTEIEKQFGKRLPISTLLQAPTLAQLAEILHDDAWEPRWSSLVEIKGGGEKPPLFLVHGAEGNILLYQKLASYLDADQVLYGLQSQGLQGSGSVLSTIEEMATYYIKEIKSLQKKGPYYLGGYCLGGIIALEMAQQLGAQGEQVALVAMIEAYNVRLINTAQSRLLSPFHLLQNIQYHLKNFLLIKSSDRWKFLDEKWRVEKRRIGIKLAVWSNTLKQDWNSNNGASYTELVIKQSNEKAAYDYLPKTYSGRVVVFRPKVHFLGQNDPEFGWGEVVQNGLSVRQLPVYPKGMLVEPYVRILAKELKVCLEEVQK